MPQYTKIVKSLKAILLIRKKQIKILLVKKIRQSNYNKQIDNK